MLLPQFIILNKLRRRAEENPPASQFPRPVERQQRIAARLRLRHHLMSVLLLLLGVCSAAFGLKAFLLPNNFIDGGVTGMSLLVRQLTGLPLSVLIVVINTPFIVMAYFQMGRVLAFKTLGAVLALAVVLLLVSFPTLTQDKLLISVFGGFFLGAGIGLAMRGGGVLDGTEILAVFLSKKTSLTVGDIILLFNIAIFAVAAWVLSVETALYSILAYMSAAKTIDFIIDGIEEYIGVTIVSGSSDAIRRMITEKLGRGATVYNGKGGYGTRGEQPSAIDIVFTVLTRLELSRLKAEVEQIDQHAFIVMHSVKDTKGGMIKKRPLH